MADGNAPLEHKKPQILCVDDDADVREGVTYTLFKYFDVLTAPSGEAALKLLETHPDVVTIVSDMRMPGMNGATLLSKVKDLNPNITRILLTGYADIDNAINAVNEGEIFRFLTKPCPPDKLQHAVAAGVVHHRQITAEHILLQQTLKGCVEALINSLVLAEPLIFGISSRAKYLVGQIASAVNHPYSGELETAALLYNLGMMGKSPDAVAELIYDDPKTAQEHERQAAVIEQTDRLLSTIPRIERIRWMIQLAYNPEKPTPSDIAGEDLTLLHQAADILRLCQRFCVLEQRGLTAEAALALIQTTPSDRLPAHLVQRLQHIIGLDRKNAEFRALPLRALKRGMVLAEALKTASGQLLAPAGYVVTTPFAERAANMLPGTVKEPIKVILRRAM